jgi:SWI/SNF-related matrix-associated actin-dependent regulator of chromatin subfamily E protein 1
VAVLQQSMTAHWNMSGPVSHSVPASIPPPSSSSTSSSSSRSKHHHHSNLQIPPPPKPPDRPLLPYMRYSRKTWEQLKADGKRVWESPNIAQVGRLIGQKWRELSDEEKQPYHDEYEAEKAVYVEQMKAYRSSPAYKRWLELKQQAEQANREAAAAQALSSSSSQSYLHHHHHQEYGPPPPSVIAPSRHSMESRLQMMQQQQQDDEEDEYITMKQVAAVRFHRNHRLMMEVFSDVCVPDPRTVVSKTRLAILTKQVQSLETHKRRLEDEVRQLEGKFEQKKRQFLANSVKFRRELKRVRSILYTTIHGSLLGWLKHKLKSL